MATTQAQIVWRVIQVPEKCSVTQIRSLLLLADSLIHVPNVSVTFRTCVGFPMEAIRDSAKSKKQNKAHDYHSGVKQGIQFLNLKTRCCLSFPFFCAGIRPRACAWWQVPSPSCGRSQMLCSLPACGAFWLLPFSSAFPTRVSSFGTAHVSPETAMSKQAWLAQGMT